MFRHASFALPLASGAALALTLAGCPSDVDRRAQQGLDALDACDVRAAHEAFTDAHAMDESRADIALAFALTDLGTLAEDPALVALAPRLGFDRTLDTAMLWGRDGLLDRLSRGDDCDTLEPWFRTTFPHPSARSDGPEFWSTVDPTLTLGDVRTALVALEPRLTEVARALELAASGLDDGGVTIEGGCGLSARPTRVQAPELLALAATLDALVAVTETLRGYDGSLPFTYVFQGASGREAAWVTAMNAGFFAPTDAAAVGRGRPMLRDAIAVALRAVDAARAERGRTHPADAIFDWTAVPVVVLDDLETLGEAAETALDEDGMHAIPRLSPALSIDVGSFFTPPFDGTSEGPIWSVESDEWGTWVASDGEALQRLLASHFDQDPWADGAPSRSFSIDWSGVESSTWEQLFDPGDRWSTTYACE